MSNCGKGETHCCWLGKAGECSYIKKSEQPDFNWACGLREKYGSWEAVYKTLEYQENVQPFWIDYPVKGMRCGDWPYKGQKCNDCGEVNDG